MSNDSSEMEKALFTGPVTLRNLSSRLAIGDPIGDEEITSLFNPEILSAFRFAQESLKGISRKNTGEPAFCHSFDIAIRALDLDYPVHVLNLCLLHDVVEEHSGTLGAYLRNYRRIASEFGHEIAQDVRILTNRYSIVLKMLKNRRIPPLPFEHDSLNVLRESLAVFMNRQPASHLKEFRNEFDRIMNHFFHRVDLALGEKKARFDRSYSVLDELILQSYALYMEELNDSVMGRKSGEFYEVPLVVKFLDIVDNLRTSEIGNWTAIEKILLKSEMALDKSFYLHHNIFQGGFHETTFILLYDYLKYNLVEQLHERSRALSFLADTRFGYLADYLEKQIGRLHEKYMVSQSLVKGIERMRTGIKEINRRLWSQYVFPKYGTGRQEHTATGEDR